MANYEAIINQFSPLMKAGENDRVGLLRRILVVLGNPDQQYKIIHIAGTNGKGSTGQIITQALMTKGYKVGHFASPAMLDDREQVQINNRWVTKRAFVKAYETICQKLPAEIISTDLTVFEWWTLIALQVFADEKVDWAVIEVGLGGENDATNAISAPQLAVITHLALDHTRILGSTLTAIAKAKAGIFKTGSQAAIIAPGQVPEALAVLKQRAGEVQLPLISATTFPAEWVAKDRVKVKFKGQTVISNFGLLGEYQLANLKTALAALTVLSISWTATEIENFLSQVNLPGRFQLINQQPIEIIDGAHNPDGAKHLITALRSQFPNRKFTFILGFLADKNVSQMVKDYQKCGTAFYLVTPDNPKRALEADALRQVLPRGIVCQDVRVALKTVEQVADEQTIIVVTGSFYLIKDILKFKRLSKCNSNL